MINITITIKRAPEPAQAPPCPCCAWDDEEPGDLTGVAAQAADAMIASALDAIEALARRAQEDDL